MPTAKFKYILLVLVFCSSFFLLGQKFVLAISLDECQNKNVNDLGAADRDWCLNTGFPQIINSLAPAQTKNKQDLASLQSQLSGINQKVGDMTRELKTFEANIEKREKELSFTEAIFNEKVGTQYRFLRTYDPV